MTDRSRTFACQNLATGLETGKLRGGETVLAINNSSAAAWSSALPRV
jgi:hypothetical protein